MAGPCLSWIIIEKGLDMKCMTKWDSRLVLRYERRFNDEKADAEKMFSVLYLYICI